MIYADVCNLYQLTYIKNILSRAVSASGSKSKLTRELLISFITLTRARLCLLLFQLNNELG